MYFEGKKLQYLILKITTELQLGRDLREHLVQPSCAKHDLDQMSQGPVQPNLNSVQHWGNHHFLREITPMAGCSRGEIPSCNVQAESPQE